MDARFEYRCEPDRTIPLDGSPPEWCWRIFYRLVGQRRWRKFLLLGVDDPTEDQITQAIERHANG